MSGSPLSVCPEDAREGIVSRADGRDNRRRSGERVADSTRFSSYRFGGKLSEEQRMAVIECLKTL
jgi:hypothetical protein